MAAMLTASKIVALFLLSVPVVNALTPINSMQKLVILDKTSMGEGENRTAWPDFGNVVNGITATISKASEAVSSVVSVVEDSAAAGVITACQAVNNTLIGTGGLLRSMQGEVEQDLLNLKHELNTSTMVKRAEMFRSGTLMILGNITEKLGNVVSSLQRAENLSTAALNLIGQQDTAGHFKAAMDQKALAPLLNWKTELERSKDSLEKVSSAKESQLADSIAAACHDEFLALNDAAVQMRSTALAMKLSYRNFTDIIISRIKGMTGMAPSFQEKVLPSIISVMDAAEVQLSTAADIAIDLAQGIIDAQTEAGIVSHKKKEEIGNIFWPIDLVALVGVSGASAALLYQHPTLWLPKGQN